MDKFKLAMRVMGVLNTIALFIMLVMSLEADGKGEFSRASYYVGRHTLERLDSFVNAIVGKRLTYARLIAKVPA